MRTEKIKRKVLLLISAIFIIVISHSAGKRQPVLIHQAHAGSIIAENLTGQASSQSGQLVWQMNIPLPSIGQNMVPALGIRYQQGGQNGYLGLGFELTGLSVIHRCPASKKLDGKKKPLQFDRNDHFCLDGKRLLLVAGENATSGAEYKVLDDPMIKVIAKGKINKASPKYWQVYTRDGYIVEYGKTPASVERWGNRVLSWTVSNRADRFNHKIHYQYQKYKGKQRLQTINYGRYRVKLEYRSANQAMVSWKFGNKITLDSILSAIVVQVDGQLLYRYALQYDNVANHKRLSTIIKCYADGNCTAPLRFNYQQTADINDIGEKNIIETDNLKGYVASDLNQDGLTDICYYQDGLQCVLQQSDTTFASPETWSSREVEEEQIGSISLMDINQDGLPDYCLMDESGFYCQTNNGENQFTRGKYWTTQITSKDAWFLNDINLDGQVDICRFSNKGLECQQKNRQTFFGYASDKSPPMDKNRKTELPN